MMKYYNFYFDEIFHDRKITIKPEGKINVFDDEKNDNYIGVFWGYPKMYESKIHEQLSLFEEKHREKYGLKREFKSKTIKKKNYTYGIRTLQREALNFYCDFFELMNDISPIIHVNAVSKVELLVRNIFVAQAFNNVSNTAIKLFYYSMSKFLLTYHTPELIKSMYNAVESGYDDEFKHVLMEHLFKVIQTMDGIARKKREIEACEFLIRMLMNYDMDLKVKEKYNFVYYQNFEGLINLLHEKNICLDKVNLTIDKEEATYKSIPMNTFASVSQKDSTESIEVRCADFLCGFIGRMIYALMNDRTIKEDPVVDIDRLKYNDISRKHLLSKEWFEIKEIHFNLYKSAQALLITKQMSYWSTMTWSFCDQICIFYSLLNYISSYNNYEQFKKISSEAHTEYFNLRCCSDLEQHYANFYK